MYCYLIGWTKFQKYYYGARWSKNSSPSDLWKTYFTSSKSVKKFVEDNGNPDLIQIRKIFTDRLKVQKWEKKVLKKLKVVTNNKWLNKAVGGEVYTDSETLKKRWLDGKYKNRKRHPNMNYLTSLALKKKWSKEKHHCAGTKLTEEHKKNISKGIKTSKSYLLAKENNLFSRPGNLNGMYGKKHNEETLKKIKIRARNRKKIPCQKCSREISPGAMWKHIKYCTTYK
jgi:hypothetical protein